MQTTGEWIGKSLADIMTLGNPSLETHTTRVLYGNYLVTEIDVQNVLKSGGRLPQALIGVMMERLDLKTDVEALIEDSP